MWKKKDKKKDRKVCVIAVTPMRQDSKRAELEEMSRAVGEASGIPKEILKEWSEETITISKKEFMDKSAHAAFGTAEKMDAPLSVMMALPKLLAEITEAVFGEDEEEDDDGQRQTDE